MDGLLRVFRLTRYLARERGTRILVALACVTCSGMAVEAFRLVQAPALDISSQGLSSADLLALLFVGRRPFEQRPGVFFIPPLEWLLIMMAIMLAGSVGSDAPWGTRTEHAMAFARSRKVWWWAHVLLTLVLTAASLALLALVAWLLALALGSGASSLLHVDVLKFEELAFSALEVFPLDGAPVLLVQGLSIIAMAQAQLTLSLVLGPTVSYVASAAMLVASSYAQRPWLLGNHAMLARSAELFSDGIAIETSAAVAALALALAVMAGAYVVTKVDVMGKGDRR